MLKNFRMKLLMYLLMFPFQIIVGARLQKLAYVHRSHAVPVILQFSNGVGSNYSNLIINDKALKSANTIFIHDHFVKLVRKVARFLRQSSVSMQRINQNKNKNVIRKLSSVRRLKTFYVKVVSFKMKHHSISQK